MGEGAKKMKSFVPDISVPKEVKFGIAGKKGEEYIAKRFSSMLSDARKQLRRIFSFKCMDEEKPLAALRSIAESSPEGAEAVALAIKYFYDSCEYAKRITKMSTSVINARNKKVNLIKQQVENMPNEERCVRKDVRKLVEGMLCTNEVLGTMYKKHLLEFLNSNYNKVETVADVLKGYPKTFAEKFGEAAKVNLEHVEAAIRKIRRSRGREEIV